MTPFPPKKRNDDGLPFEYDPREFEVFTEKGTKTSSPFITIVKPSAFSFSSGAVREYGLDRFQYASLSYNSEKHAVRIVLNNTKDTKGNYGIVVRGHNLVIPCVAFFNYYGLYIEKLSGKYDVHPIGHENNTFIVTLQNKAKEYGK